MAELILTLLFVIGFHYSRQPVMNLPGPVQNKPIVVRLIPGNIKQLGINNFEPVSGMYAPVINVNPLNYSNDSFYGWRNSTMQHTNYIKLNGQKKYNYFKMHFTNTFRNIKIMRYSTVFTMQERSKEVKPFPQPHRFGFTETRTDKTLLFIAD